MSRKLAEYLANTCLGYSLVFFGTVVLGSLVPQAAAVEAGEEPSLLALSVAAGVMLLLMVLGAGFAVVSGRGR